MHDPEVIEIAADKWAETTAQFLDNNFEQSLAYSQESARKIGGKPIFLAVRTSSKIIAAASLRVKEVPLIGGNIAYLPSGPMLRQSDAPDSEGQLKTVIEALRDYLVSKGNNILRIRPVVRADSQVGRHNAVFQEMGFYKSRSAGEVRTLIVDLSPDKDQLRKNLKQKWRNCLNAAEKKELSVEMGQGVEWLERFGGLYGELLERKGFRSALDFDFFGRVEAMAQGRDRLWVLIVSDESGDLAGHVGSLLGDTAVYILGASNNSGRSAKAAYLANWTAMIHAKRNGCSWYDLGGFDPGRNPGVARYKSGMGGLEPTYSGTFEISSRGFGAQVILAAESIYRQSSMIREIFPK